MVSRAPAPSVSGRAPPMLGRVFPPPEELPLPGLSPLSSQKETVASKVLSPSIFTSPKSFITPLTCTICTGSETGSVPGGGGPGGNLATLTLPA